MPLGKSQMNRRLRRVEHVSCLSENDTGHATSSGFGIGGAVIARKNLTSNIDNDAMKADFGMYIKLLPNRDNGPNISPMNAILALNDLRTIRSKVDQFSKSTMKISN